MTTPESPSSAVVLRFADLKTYRRADGILTTPLVSAAVGARSFITGVTELAPGAAHRARESEEAWDHAA